MDIYHLVTGLLMAIRLPNTSINRMPTVSVYYSMIHLNTRLFPLYWFENKRWTWSQVRIRDLNDWQAWIRFHQRSSELLNVRNSGAKNLKNEDDHVTVLSIGQLLTYEYVFLRLSSRELTELTFRKVKARRDGQNLAKRAQWGSEIRTSLDFEWSKRG